MWFKYYSCEVDVTCLVKKKCDGLHECSFSVNDSFVSGDLCPGLSNYLYFEYQCVDTVKRYKEPCGMYKCGKLVSLVKDFKGAQKMTQRYFESKHRIILWKFQILKMTKLTSDRFI